MNSIPTNAAVSDVWTRVQAWPVSDRMTLAEKILQSVAAERANSASPAGRPPPKPTDSPANLIGQWSHIVPQPSVADMNRLLEEAILEEHG